MYRKLCKRGPRRADCARWGASVAAGIGLVLAAATVSAHHAFNSEFDANKPVKVQGTVSKVEWINPHAWIHIDVKKADGTVEKWMFEAGTPNTLMRRGLTKNSVAIGTEVIADGYQSKDGICEPACRANGRDLRLPDGRTLLLGADGGGAPR